jgi:hypothetical protein
VRSFVLFSSRQPNRQPIGDPNDSRPELQSPRRNWGSLRSVTPGGSLMPVRRDRSMPNRRSFWSCCCGRWLSADLAGSGRRARSRARAGDLTLGAKARQPGGDRLADQPGGAGDQDRAWYALIPGGVPG